MTLRLKVTRWNLAPDKFPFSEIDDIQIKITLPERYKKSYYDKS